MTKQEAIEWVDYHLAHLLNEGVEKTDELYKALRMARNALAKENNKSTKVK